MNRTHRFGMALWLLVSLLGAATPLVSGQTEQAATRTQMAPVVVLSVGGEVEKPLKLTAADLTKLPRHTVRAKEHNGKESAFG